MDINAVREGLAQNLKAIPGLQAEPYALNSPTPPAAHVLPGESEYHLALQDGDEMETFRVEVFVSATTDIGSQKRLGEFLAYPGPLSVKAALEQTLDDGHTPANMPDGVYDVTVVGHDGQGDHQIGEGIPVLGTTFTVNVRASRES